MRKEIVVVGIGGVMAVLALMSPPVYITVPLLVCSIFLIASGLARARTRDAMARIPVLGPPVWRAYEWVESKFFGDDGRQEKLDQISEEISWAIHNLINRNPPPSNDSEIGAWNDDFTQWCARINAILSDRNVFTKSDSIHFERLGVVPITTLPCHPNMRHGLSMLALKIERAREIVRHRQRD